MTDPTWNREEIKANPIWEAAFVMSECLNDNAPIGWSKYIWVVEQLPLYKRPKTKPTKKARK